MHKNKRALGFYYKDVLTILHQSQTKLLLEDDINQVVSYLTKTNSTYITYSTLIGLEPNQPFFNLLFGDWKIDTIKTLENCLDIINHLKDRLFEKKAFVALEYAYGIYRVFNQLATLNTQYNYLDSFESLYHFYRDALSAETIDLKGSPYKGLQIMGLLESRLLDFDHIIIASVNEGILPTGKKQNSYLPFDLRVAYGLPTYQEQDTVYAYHFYHTLQRAKTAHLLYTAASEGLGASEKSRFLMQLNFENIHKIKALTASASFNTVQANPDEIEKTPEVIQKIQQIATKGFSPSSLAAYIKDPLSFYRRYILGIKESDQVEESLAANTIGTIIHNTLEVLYTPYLSKNALESQDMDTMLSHMVTKLDEQYWLVYKNKNYTSGKNKIIYEVILKYISTYLNYEKKCIDQGSQQEVLALEKSLQTNIDIPNISYPITLKGTIDSISKRDGILTIIDYKTGKLTASNLVLKNWEDLIERGGKYEKAFQLLTYAYMVYKQHSNYFPLQAGIIPLKYNTPSLYPFSYQKDTLITEETILSYEQQLHSLIREICDPSVPFFSSVSRPNIG